MPFEASDYEPKLHGYDTTMHEVSHYIYCAKYNQNVAAPPPKLLTINHCAETVNIGANGFVSLVIETSHEVQ